MITLGDPESTNASGEKCEVRFFTDQRMTVVVHSDRVRNFHVNMSVRGFTLGVLELFAGQGERLDELLEQDVFEVWVDTPRHDTPQRLALLKLEYCDYQFEGTEATLEIQGRSPTAAIVDEPWETAFDGDLQELLRLGCEGLGVRATVNGVDSQQVTAYVRCPSTYGALRLLASSVNAVVSDKMDEVLIESVEAAKARLAERPVVRIGTDQVRSGRFTKGRPLRRDD